MTGLSHEGCHHLTLDMSVHPINPLPSEAIQDPATLLTFDLQEHELLVGHGAVVGHLLGDIDAAQVDVAEVLLAGQTGQSHVREAGVLTR